MDKKYCSVTYEYLEAFTAGNGGSKRTYDDPWVVAMLRALAIIAVLLLILSIASVAVQLRVRRQTFFVKRIQGYWCINSNVISTVALVLFSCWAISAVCALYWLVWSRHSISRISPLLISAPASLFLWCWFHAASNVYSIQIVQGRLDGWARHLRLPPRLVNIAIVAVPSFVLVCVALPLLVAGYFMGRDVTLTFRSAYYIARDDPSRRVEALANASKTCLRSERMYKTIWSIWALCFLLTWVLVSVYGVAYVKHLHQRIQAIHRNPANANGGGTPGGDQSLRLDKDREQALNLLRGNNRLRIGELILFGICCLVWTGIAIFKAVEAFDTLATSEWLISLSIEIWLACALAAAMLSITIARALIERQGRQVQFGRARRPHEDETSANAIKVTVQTTVVNRPAAGRWQTYEDRKDERPDPFLSIDDQIVTWCAPEEWYDDETTAGKHSQPRRVSTVAHAQPDSTLSVNV